MRFRHISLSLACMIILLHAIIPHHHHPDKPICIHQLNHNDCDNHENCCDFSDEENHKVTCVTLMGLEKAKEEVGRLSNEAVALLKEMGYEHDFLEKLIIDLIHRNN